MSVLPQSLRISSCFARLTLSRTGGVVQTGPFAGMRYVDRSVGSAFVPKLLGIYERELNDCIETACAMKFPLIVDVGAAEGYYAVGLARRNPQARVIAFEMQEQGRAAVREMAALNGIAVRNGEPAKAEMRNPSTAVPISDFQPAAPISASQDFSISAFQDGVSAFPLELHGKCEFENLQATLASADRSLVVCDVEGYEEILLVPEKIPALARAHLLVETHDFCRPGITDRLTARFSPTHHVQRIWQQDRSAADFPYRSVITRLLPRKYTENAVNEWRPERMSWLWMVPNTER